MAVSLHRSLLQGALLREEKMSSWMMWGLIGWMVLIGVSAVFEGNYPLIVYGFCGAGLNVAVLMMAG